MRKAHWMIAVAGLSTAAFAAGGMQPGMWEYTMKMEMTGMPFAMPPQTFQRCMTQQDVDSGEYGKNPREKSDCKMSNMKRDAGKISYDVVCTGDHAAKGHYDFTMAKDSMSGAGTLTMDGGQTMKQNFAAKRVGDCK